jgi:hypothetical protein
MSWQSPEVEAGSASKTVPPWRYLDRNSSMLDWPGVAAGLTHELAKFACWLFVFWLSFQQNGTSSRVLANCSFRALGEAWG